MKQGFAPDSAIPNVEPDLCAANIQSRFDQNTPTNHKLSPLGSILIKNILFVCSQCDGPLIPSSTCIICKKTAIRRCTRCGTIRDMGLHDSCKNLAILRNEISSHSFEMNNEGEVK